MQYGILSLLAPIYGAFADARERKTPHYGRSQVLLAGVVFGTFCFLLHGASHVWEDCAFLDRFLYHFMVQSLYAGCLAAMFPILDGMTLDYLQRRHGDSMDYGKERLYGAVSWGVTNLLFGPLIDKFGFEVVYP
jgi:MFS family permease